MFADIERFVSDRVSMLLAETDIPESQISRELGHSKGYLQNITSGRCLPSLRGLYEICEYFDITLRDFFDTEEKHPPLVCELNTVSKGLSEERLKLLLEIARQFSNEK